MSHGTARSRVLEVHELLFGIVQEFLVGHEVNARYLHLVARNVVWVGYDALVHGAVLVNDRLQTDAQRERSYTVQVYAMVEVHVRYHLFLQPLHGPVERKVVLLAMQGQFFLQHFSRYRSMRVLPHLIRRPSLLIFQRILMHAELNLYVRHSVCFYRVLSLQSYSFNEHLPNFLLIISSKKEASHWICGLLQSMSGERLARRRP